MKSSDSEFNHCVILSTTTSNDNTTQRGCETEKNNNRKIKSFDFRPSMFNFVASKHGLKKRK